MGKHFTDLTGKLFGRLTVIKHVGLKKGNHRWECDCKCGNTIVCTTGHLNNNHTRSCGCLNKDRLDDLTGQIFGNLTVIERVLLRINKKNKKIFGWLCQCKCGNTTRTRGLELKNGRAKSCGCLNKTGFGEIGGRFWYAIVAGAKSRNLEFNITKEFIWNLFLKQNKKCALTGWPIELYYTDKILNTASLDRIDSSKGYTEDNVQWVHKDVNFAKQEYSMDYFLQICKSVAANNKDKGILEPHEINWI